MRCWIDFEQKDFESLVTSRLKNPAGTDEAKNALSLTKSGTVDAFINAAGFNSRFSKRATSTAANATAFLPAAPPSPAQSLGELRDRYCYPQASKGEDPDADFPVFNQRLLDLAQLISQQNSLSQDAVSLGLKQKTIDLQSEIKTFQDPKLSGFRRTVAHNTFPRGLEQFKKMINDSGFLEQTDQIDNITILPSSGEQRGYQGLSPGSQFFQAVNKKYNDSKKDPDSASLARLKANLKSLVSQWADLSDAIDTYIAIADQVETLKNAAQTIVDLQNTLNDLSVSLIESGSAANCVAQGMPLPSMYDRTSLGTWYSGETITLELKQGTRLPAYDLAGLQSITQVDLSKDPAAPKGATTGPVDTSTSVAKTSFQIHNLYHFQLAAGFMRSWIHDVKFQAFQQSTTTSGTTTTDTFFAQTRNRSYRVLPTINVIYYPFAREFFPWKARYDGEVSGKQAWVKERLKEVGAQAGFSLTDPTKDFFFGGAWVPRSGIGIQGGIHYGYVDQLPPGVSLNTPVTANVTSVSQRLDHAWFFGPIMHMQVFQQLFGVIFKK